MRTAPHILIVALVAAAAHVASADDPAAALRARQLLIARAIDSELEGSLVASLNRNKTIWANLTPEQRRQYRDRYNAFRRQDPERQADLIEAFEAFNKLTPRQQEMYRRREIWLKRVVSSLSAQQREELKKLPPAERARRLLRLKADLVDKKAPATQPPE